MYTWGMSINDIAAELAALQAGHANMPIRELQTRRAAAMDAARVIYNNDNTSRDDFMAAYDLIIELDRVGY